MSLNGTEISEVKLVLLQILCVTQEIGIKCIYSEVKYSHIIISN